MKQMMLIFSHPDDESFSTGITIRKYVDLGWTVSLVVATSGEKGQTGPLGDIGEDELAQIRKSELEAAGKILGIGSIEYLPYHDGTLKEVPAGELEQEIYKKIVEKSPDIIITHDPTGMSNHPDHIRMCFSTTFAFQKYAKDIEDTRKFIVDVENRDPDVKKRHFVSRHSFALKQERFAELVEKDNLPLLYYSCVPETVVTFLQKKKLLPEESFDKVIQGTPDKKITTVIEAEEKDTLAKLQALAKHVSQTDDVDRFYELESNPLTKKEFFILRMHGTTEVYMGNSDIMSDSL